jgi:cyclic pyranopterin phosphate synthase
MLTHADVEVTVEAEGVRILATAATTAQTGVEMEALTAASVAALTVYDMVKGVEKGVEIRAIRLVSKTGGKSGDWVRNADGSAPAVSPRANPRRGGGRAAGRIAPHKPRG